MTTLDAIILGIVQGVTEFLPLSSSGHLHLVTLILNIHSHMMFDLVCHLGTLCATLLFFYDTIKEIIKNNRVKIYQLMIAILPLFPLLMIIKPIKSIYADPKYLGFFFLITSLLLFIGEKFSREKSKALIAKHCWRDAALIGMCQACAVFPGISRSGSTISSALILGWNKQEALKFSFLLAIPTILGGVVLEVLSAYRHPETVISLPFSHYLIGFVISFFVGIATLKFLMFFITRYRFSSFAWYCLFLGIATTCYFYI